LEKINVIISVGKRWKATIVIFIAYKTMLNGKYNKIYVK